MKFVSALSLMLLAMMATAQAPVGEIPPHPLDSAFERRHDGSITNGLLNNPLFQRAVQEAARTYRETEELQRRNFGIVGASPKRAARARFLEVLNGDLGAQR